MRKLFTGVMMAVFLFSGLGFFAVPKVMADTIELKMSHFMPTKHIQHAKVMVPWAKKIEELSKGRMKVTIFPGGALGKPPHQYDNAVKGITDIAFGLQSYTPGRFPLTSSMRLPFMIKSGEQGARVLWRTYEKYLQNEYKDVKVLWLLMHPPGQIFTTKKQVKRLEDLKGLKIRTPGPIMSKVLKRLGAVPVTMPITQVYTALERKTVDGVAVPYETMRPFRFFEQCKFAAEANIYSMTFFEVMNKKKYESLPPDLKQIIDENSGLEWSIKAAVAYDRGDKPNRELFLEKGGQIYQLPPAERERWIKAAAPVRENWIQEMKGKGLPGPEVLNYVSDQLANTP